MGRRRDRHCPPCARPSSNSSLDHRRSDARAAENGFAAKSSVNKSAKVVLADAWPAAASTFLQSLHDLTPRPTGEAFRWGYLFEGVTGSALVDTVGHTIGDVPKVFNRRPPAGRKHALTWL